MSTDERVAMRLESAGIDLESDEGARLYQQELEKAIERERERQWQQPPPMVERVHGIRI